MKRKPVSFLVATVLSVFAAPQASANCTAKFTQIPDFVIPGEPIVDGTCKHQTDIPGLTDLLQVTVEAGRDCDPIANECTVTIVATWVGGGAMTTKGPFTAQEQKDGDGWPHNV